jgi:ribonuclease R
MWKKKGTKTDGKPTHLKGKEIGEFYRQRAIERKNNGWGKKKDKPLGTKRKNAPYEQTHLGVFQPHGQTGFLWPCHRKDTFPGVLCPPEIASTLTYGDVVIYGVGFPDRVHINKRLGNLKDANIFSLMAIQEQQIPTVFSKESLELANKGHIPTLERREDMRHIPFVTIDGADARDFDDAVWATPDTSEENLGGWRIIVAIADVSYYVKPNDALDKAAFERGNSVYFPDHVVPMLPESLSNGLCSLKPKEDRACLAVEMIISKNGTIQSYTFKRGLMHSVARLTYEQVQNAIDGQTDATTAPLLKTIIMPLYGAYKSLLKSRKQRGTLNLDIPEQKVRFDENGKVVEIIRYEVYKSHQLIEEMMIAANVCAAKTLLKHKQPGLFRVHDKPDMMGINNLTSVLKSLNLSVMRKEKNYSPHHFNDILSKTHSSPYERLVHGLVLRCQSQASYASKNIGHFGLSLEQYTHFTSPIRRYSDLVVHRCLIATLNLGDDGFVYPPEELDNISEHINMTERRATIAERDTMDRYVTAFLKNHVGETFSATIVGVTKIGIFVALDSTGAQGLIHKRNLPGDYYNFDEAYHRYIGTRRKKTYQLGQSVQILVEDVNAVNCTTSFSLQRHKGKAETKKKVKNE